jgi:uncharacterized sulfatase
MDRRDFLRTTGAAALAAAGHCAEPARPNILFLFGDDWAWPHASCLGTPQIQTPTFDRLAREGVLFRHAHAAAPSCSPSRAAILTGQWHWRLGDGANLRGSLDPRHAVYPDLLERAGYHVGLSGKGYAPGTWQGWPHNPAGRGFRGFEAFLTARPKGQPFCFWLGSGFPHRAYPLDSGPRAGFDPAKVVVPPYLPDNETVRRDICDYQLAAQSFDRHAGEALAGLERSGELDNTLIVMSGDNGWPFPRGKATCYASGTHQPLAVRWGARVAGGRGVDDFVSLADLAPTFLEAAGLKPPPTMTARSFLDVLLSAKPGRVDPRRDHTLTGMETHVRCRALPDGTLGGYPMRTLLTHDFHYLRNFAPERWPAGDPPAAGATPDFAQYAKTTHVGYADIDAGPTKAWIVTHRDEPATRPFFDRACGPRPARELYDLRHDPHELRNVAEEPAYAATVKALDARLLAQLQATADPRA